MLIGMNGTLTDDQIRRKQARKQAQVAFLLHSKRIPKYNQIGEF